MSTAFARGWRKLYRHPSTDWLALPLSSRSLGNELVRIAEDDGSICVGASPPHEAVARLLAAHRDEYRRVKLDLDRLLADGFCRVSEGRLWIRNFAVAQGLATVQDTPAPTAAFDDESPEERQRRLHRERTARWRESRRRDAGDASPSQPPSPGDASPSQPPSPGDASPSQPPSPGDASTVTATVTETVTGDALPSQTLPSENPERTEGEEKRTEKEAERSSAHASVTVTVTKSVTGDAGDAPRLSTVTELRAGKEPEKAAQAPASQPPSKSGAPSLRAVLDGVAKWSKGRISELVTTADGLDLMRVIERLHREHGVDQHDYDTFGAWAAKDTGKGFAGMRRPPSWNFLLGDDRQGARLLEALGESRLWEREEEEKEARALRQKEHRHV